MANTKIPAELSSTPGIIDNSNATAITIDSSENVGIGTGSPALQSGGTGLHVNGSSYSEIKFTNSSTGTGATDGTALVTNSLDFGINNREGGKLTFGTSNSTRMTIDSSGNLLVGKTAVGMANEGIELNAGDYLGITKNGAPCAYLRRNTNDGTIIEFRKDTATVGSIGTSAGHLYVGAGGDTNLLFNDTANSIYPWDASANDVQDATVDLGASTARFKDLYLSGGTIVAGRTTFGSAGFWDASGTGNNKGLRVGGAGLYPTNGTGTPLDATLDIGTATARFNDLYLSGGVRLGGTGSANELDDYEEGTWTPTLTGSGYSFGTHTGAYVKVGKMVYVTAHLSITGVGTANSSLGFGGCPFTAYNANNNHQVGIIRESATTGRIYVCQINVNNTIGSINSMDGISNGSNEIFTTGSYSLSMTYRAA